MTLSKYKTLKPPDFENGATRDEIYAALKRGENIEAVAQFILNNRDKFQECDPDGLKKSVLDQLKKRLE